MSELRLILLVAGLLFIAGIAGFEWWRGRRARALSAAPREDLASEPPASASKPLPDIHVVREPRVAVQDNLPVIELASTSASGTRRALGISISDEVAVDATPATSHASSTSLQSASGRPARRLSRSRIEKRIGFCVTIATARRRSASATSRTSTPPRSTRPAVGS